MDTLSVPVENFNYAYLEDVSWNEYETLLESVGERPIRFTYDKGRLEIMTLSHEHEFESRVLGRLVGGIKYPIAARRFLSCRWASFNVFSTSWKCSTKPKWFASSWSGLRRRLSRG